MFLDRNVLTKPQWMGIAALIIALIMTLNPVLALAEEADSDEEIVIISSDGEETVIGGNVVFDEPGDDEGLVGSAQGKAAEILDDDEIWALVDKDELRSLIDVDSLRAGIDVLALMESIDRDELRAEIDAEALLSEIDEEDLKEEFEERKLDGEYFVVDDQTGEARIVSEEEYAELKNTAAIADNEADSSFDEETDEVVIEDAAEDFVEDSIEDASLAEIISEETHVLEDGQEVKTFMVKLPGEEVDSHPMDVINVQLPIIDESSPFDFLIDPMKLMYNAYSSFDGDIVVEDAGVLFKNKDGQYDFSHKSDMLKVVNKSNVPVKLTIRASIENPESVPLVDSASELYGEDPNLFMALADEVGVASVITSYGEALIETVLEPAPEGTYSFTWDEENGKYNYFVNDVSEDIVEDGAEEDIEENAEETEDSVFDSYSFGVEAACNTEADWSQVDSRPVINVEWNVEPVLTDWDKVNAELEAERRAQLLANEEEFEAFKLVKAKELAEERLIELISERLNELKELEIEAMIEEEVTRLALEKYAEIMGIEDMYPEEAETTIIEGGDDQENVEIIESNSSESESTNDDAKSDSEDTIIIETPETESTINTEGNETNKATEESNTDGSDEVVIIESSDG